MSVTELLKSIGYPEPDLPTPREPSESKQLYDLARKNKVGSLYVRSLNESNQITELNEQWDNRRSFRGRIRETLNRLPEVIPRDIDYAVVKSGYPWVDSKDVDIVLFDDRFEEMESLLLNEGYEFCGRSPTSFDVLDPVTDIQLDVQSDFSLQRVVYFDKQTVADGVERRSPFGTAIPILERPDDLALIVIHSITEQMFILKELYTAVASLESFSRHQFERFLRVVKVNSIEPACRAFFTVAWELCERVFGRRPPYLRELLNRFGVSSDERAKLRANELETPHRYSGKTGVRTITGKLRNPVFRRTLASQVPRLAQPSTARYVLSQILTRRQREHYVHDTSDMGTEEIV